MSTQVRAPSSTRGKFASGGRNKAAQGNLRQSRTPSKLADVLQQYKGVRRPNPKETKQTAKGARPGRGHESSQRKQSKHVVKEGKLKRPVPTNRKKAYENASPMVPQNKSKAALLPTTSAQISKLCKWFYDQSTKDESSECAWWNIKDSIAKGLSAHDSSTTPLKQRGDNEMKFSGLVPALKALENLGIELLKRIYAAMKHVEGGDVDLAWIRNTANDGTLKDRFASLAFLVEKCPVVHLDDLDVLIGASSSAKNRTEVLDALELLVPLAAGKILLPETRSLQSLFQSKEVIKYFIERQIDGSYVLNTNEFTQASERLKLFTLLIFEHELKKRLNEYIENLNALGDNTVLHVRKSAIDAMYELLKSKPEQEEANLGNLVRLLSSRCNRTSSYVVEKLAQLVHIHPPMKDVVCEQVEAVIWVQKISILGLNTRQSKGRTRTEIRKRRVDERRLRRAKRAQQRAILDGRFQNDDGSKTAFKPALDLSQSKSTVLAHSAVEQAVYFLSMIKYDPTVDPPEFIRKQLNRFSRLLSEMLKPTVSTQSIVRSMERRQRRLLQREIKMANRSQIVQPTTESQTKGKIKQPSHNEQSSETLLKTEIKVELDQPTTVKTQIPVKAPSSLTKFGINVNDNTLLYINGLAHTAEGAIVVRLLLGGLKRVLPFCTANMLKQHIEMPSSDLSRDQNMETSKVLQDGSKLSGLVPQLFSMIYRFKSASTKIQTWELLYDIFSVSGRMTDTFLSNFYSELKKLEYWESKRRLAWFKLITDIIGDTINVSMSCRAALLRRFLMILHSMAFPSGSVLCAFDMLERILRGIDREVVAWLINSEQLEDESLRAKYGSIESAAQIKYENPNVKISPKRETDEHPATSVTTLNVKKERGDDQMANTGPNWNTFNPGHCRPMASQCWELSLYNCSIFQDIANASLTLRLLGERRKRDTHLLTTPCPWKDLIPIGENVNEEARIRRLYDAVSNSLAISTLRGLMRGKSLQSSVGLRLSEGFIPRDSEREGIIWNLRASNEELWNNSTVSFPFSEFLRPYCEKWSKKVARYTDIEEAADQEAERFLKSMNDSTFPIGGSDSENELSEHFLSNDESNDSTDEASGDLESDSGEEMDSAASDAGHFEGIDDSFMDDETMDNSDLSDSKSLIMNSDESESD